MSLRVIVNDCDDTNINRLWDLQANRTSHLKNLQTIYKQKETIKNKSVKDHISRQKELEKYQINKLKDFNCRNKSFQDKINYENSLLRNKILEVYESKDARRKAKSFFNKQADKLSPFKIKQAQQMYRTNLRIGQRLTNIKSQIAIQNLQKHSKKSQMLLEMVQKRSPKKRAYLKNLTKKKKNFEDIFLPQIQENL